MESFKTPAYQRRAYQKYLLKQKENINFLEERKNHKIIIIIERNQKNYLKKVK